VADDTVGKVAAAGVIGSSEAIDLMDDSLTRLGALLRSPTAIGELLFG
jgi:hypothetical protein